jgi:hypothetical protein
MNKYSSWRSDAAVEAGFTEEEKILAAKAGFFLMWWMGVFWAGAAWLVLWTIRSSGFTSFDVVWWKLCITSIVLTFVRLLDARIRK